MATAVERSGHARLKAALVLRDALAAELGVDLVRAMKALRKNRGGAGRHSRTGRRQVVGTARDTDGRIARSRTHVRLTRDHFGREIAHPAAASHKSHSVSSLSTLFLLN